MKPLQILFLLTLLQSAFITNAQDFKIIKDTDGYILKEVDSVYYYTHGIEPKNDFIIDTNKIHKVNGVLKLPLDNGTWLRYRDTLDFSEGRERYEYEGFNKKINCYLVNNEGWEWWYEYLISKATGQIDTIGYHPIYSPSYKFCGYFLNMYNLGSFGNVAFKNINSKKEIKINFEKELPNGIKWIDDNSFLFYSDLWNNDSNKVLYKKYYLVQIKK